MTVTTRSRWPWIAPIAIYVVSALEMIIMISPAAAYFYSVYTPIFHGLEQFAATAWLPQFFLPHLAHTQLPAFRWLSILGAILTLIGLLGFLWCAVQLYYGKFVRKQLVNGGLYGRVRHPQYLLLAVAGVGLLLLWPRFFILVTYLLMLGLYYALARHEEELVRAKYGQPAEDYMATVPMFNPFRRKRPGATWQPVPPRTAFNRWVLTVAGGLALAFLLRAVAISQLYTYQEDSPPVTALSLRSMPAEQLADFTRAALASDGVADWRRDNPGEGLFIQVGTGDSFLRHVLIDLGMQETLLGDVPYREAERFAVLSRLTDPAGNATPTADPLGFSTRIEPLFVVQPRADGSLEATALREERFHERFSRIRF